MKFYARLATTCAASMLTLSALANPIEIVALPDGQHPDSLGGYDMFAFDAPTDGLHSCTESSFGNDVCFDDGDGNSISLLAESPLWWEYDGSPAPVHGNIFMVDSGRHLVDLILPENTFAFSLFVGASGGGSAWIQAFNDDQEYATDKTWFGVGNNDTRGYGIYSTDCTAITRITVEPFQWGFGYFSSSEGQCQQVPEPAPIGLLGIGLLALALSRRYQSRRQLT